MQFVIILSKVSHLSQTSVTVISFNYFSNLLLEVLHQSVQTDPKLNYVTYLLPTITSKPDFFSLFQLKMKLEWLAIEDRQTCLYFPHFFPQFSSNMCMPTLPHQFKEKVSLWSKSPEGPHALVHPEFPEFLLD